VSGYNGRPSQQLLSSCCTTYATEWTFVVDVGVVHVSSKAENRARVRTRSEPSVGDWIRRGATRLRRRLGARFGTQQVTVAVSVF